MNRSAAVLFAALLAASAGAASAHEFKAGDLVIDHPWTRATPPGAAIGGGYVTIRNTGSAPDRLVAVGATVATTADIHEMSMEGDVMQMRPVAGGVEIPPGGELTLKPGGFHAMFMGLKHPLVKGASEPGTLTFEKAGTVTVDWAVEAIGATAPAED